jgi:hypothetical protein
MILFVDLEASSLEPDGYPIEVAWVDQDGKGETHLIRPPDQWLQVDAGNPGWSPESEQLHGISLATLLAEGEPVQDVAARAALLSATYVMACSDAPPSDGAWLNRLFKAAGLRRSVRLVDVRELYGLACRPLLDGLPLEDGSVRDRAEHRVRNLALEIVARAEEVEHLRSGPRHRALPDAEALWRTWSAVRDEVARHLQAEGEGPG